MLDGTKRLNDSCVSLHYDEREDTRHSIMYLIPDNWLEILIRLFLSLLIGGAIGMERSGTKHDAGLRTHVLVCLGATGVMIMSEAMAVQYQCGVDRIGAQVVSGIGFLGAGCILISGNRIRGLTTAAGLWTTACMGLAIGLGYYYISLSMAAFVMIAILLLRSVSVRLQKRKEHSIYRVRVSLSRDGTIGQVGKSLCKNECRLMSVTCEDRNTYCLSVDCESEYQIGEMICLLLEENDIAQAERL